MKIYIDTEFTHIAFKVKQDHSLISAGFVAENGNELYFELTDTYERNDCSYFVQASVLPHLNSMQYGMAAKEAAMHLRNWIETFDEEISFASDNPDYDWPLIKNLLIEHECWPINLDDKALNVGGYSIQARIQTYFEYQPMAIRHHALWDARALSDANKRQIDP